MNFGETFSSTQLIIRAWYEKNKRELPWRRTRDPYCIWISEVILQQTRVDQGIDYYKRFIETFPDVGSLARAGEDQVLKIWQGLGYYSRARNLHHTAKYIAERRGGEFPDTYNGLLELRGVGPYTAAAIASICFGEARAVVDGNVARVIARVFGVEEPVNRPEGMRQVSRLAQEVLEGGTDAPDRVLHKAAGSTGPGRHEPSGSTGPGRHEPSGTTGPGRHNQAMMEFGALQCVPVAPRCEECPLSRLCHANLTGRVEELPLKVRGKKPVDRWFYFYIITSGGATILEKRDDTGIWASLYQFPLVESDGPRSEEEAVEEIAHLLKERKITLRHFSGPLRHQLTHRTIHARFIHMEVSSLHGGLRPGWIVVPRGQIERYPVPRLIHRYLESVKF